MSKLASFVLVPSNALFVNEINEKDNTEKTESAASLGGLITTVVINGMSHFDLFVNDGFPIQLYNLFIYIIYYYMGNYRIAVNARYICL